jgi:hypothetical protein
MNVNDDRVLLLAARLDPEAGLPNDRDHLLVAERTLLRILAANPPHSTAEAHLPHQGRGVMVDPHPDRLRRPARRGRLLVAAAAVAGVSAGVMLWPGTTPSAFASWTPSAVAATTAQVAAAQVRCDSVLARSTDRIAATQAKLGVRLRNSPTSVAQLAGRTAQLAEQRGEFTFVLSTNGMWTVGCLVAPDVSEHLTLASTVDLSLHAAAPPAGGVDTLGAFGEGTTDGSSTAALAFGRVGEQVTAVDVTTVDGRVVHATVAGGYWSAWWPTPDDKRTGDAQVAVRLVDGTSVPAGTLDSLNDYSAARG